MGLSRTVSEINSNFHRKSQNSLHLFNAATEGFPLGIWYQCKGQKTTMMGLPDG